MHKAIIAKIDQIIEIPGADFIQVAKVLGEDVIVSKDMGEGYIGVFFPVDLQLSEDYCHENNLFRDATLNKDTTKKGFFEDSRRVRAQPFLKVKSSGYFAPISSLDYAVKLPASEHLHLGDSFDEIGGKKLCEKYFSPKERQALSNQKAQKKLKKSKEVPFFAKHVDSEQFKHYADRIPVGAKLHFHAKVHGTSFRVAKTEVVRPITSFFGKLKAKVLGQPLETRSMEYVVGTRNVILEDAEKDGFHGKEAFRFEVMEALKPYLTDGMSIYGEIAGYVNGSPVMPPHNVETLKDKAYTKKYGKEVTYTYGCKQHEYRFHVYRIVRQCVDGTLLDMPQAELDKWCSDRNILGPVKVYPSIEYSGYVEGLKSLVEKLTERPDVLTEDYIDRNHISEGIIIRVEPIGVAQPTFFKSKSYAFRCMEGHVEAIDPEAIA